MKNKLKLAFNLFMVLFVADQAFATVSFHKCFFLGENNTSLLKKKVNLQSWTKVFGTVIQFFCHSGSLIRQCILLEIFLQFSLPPPYTKKKFWIHASNIVCGVRGGFGPVWIGKRPEMQRPKTFAHDCSSFDFHLLWTARKSHFNLFFFVYLILFN